MRYGPQLLDEILRRIDLVQLVGRKVKLVRKGQVFWGCCPFHGEKTPSFKVENARRHYKCFGCGASGDAFKWLMETEGLSFPEAVEKLAAEAGVALPKWSVEDEAREAKKKSLIDIVEAAASFFEAELAGPLGGNARRYLQSRGLELDAARRFRLGYAPSGNRLIAHLTGLNVTQDDAVAAGLARPADERGGFRDFFFDRLMFPIADARGKLVAFGGRGLSADAKPKYINSAETPLFAKGRMLYNFAAARAEAAKSGQIILAEGYMDVIALVRAGFAGAVAPLGTALTEEQLQLMWRCAPEPLVTFDGDEAGARAARRAAQLALAHLQPGHSLRFAFLPPGEDPDSLIRKAGPAAMQTVFDQAQPLFEVLWRGETEGKDLSTPERRAGLERALSEIVAEIKDAKVADYYRQAFDQRLFQSFKKRGAQPSGRKKDFNPKNRSPSMEPPLPATKNAQIGRQTSGMARRQKEEEICHILLVAPDIAENQAEILAALPFSDPLLDRLRHEILNLAASGFGLEDGALNDHLLRLGMRDLLARLHARSRDALPKTVLSARDDPASYGDLEKRFLCAAGQLRKKAETVKRLSVPMPRRQAP